MGHLASFASAPDFDLLLVPGGKGTRSLVDDETTMSWLRRTADGCEIFTLSPKGLHCPPYDGA